MKLLEVVGLRCEGVYNPLGIDSLTPLLSWRTVSPKRGARQTAYQIHAARSQDMLTLRRPDLWDTGIVEYGDSLQISYAGARLRAFEHVYWSVRVRDQDGEFSPWSEAAQWAMGPLAGGDWQAEWVGAGPAWREEHMPPGLENWDGANWIWHPQSATGDEPAAGTVFFRRLIELPEGAAPESAVVAAADGRLELYVNGYRLGHHRGSSVARLFPAGHAFRRGKNVVAAAVTNGFRGPAGFMAKAVVEIGGRPAETAGTDSAWLTTREPGDDWRRVICDDTSWLIAATLGPPDTSPWHTPRITVSGRTQNVASPVFRKEYTVDKPVKQATAYVCGLGWFEFFINGERIGDHVLSPLFTNYEHRVLYTAHDVTAHIRQGQNAAGAMLGNGWYNMHTRAVWNFDSAPWRDWPKLLAQVRIEHDDGSVTWWVTGEDWRTARGPVLFDSVRNGEIYDARLDAPNWKLAGYDDSRWDTAKTVSGPAGRLCSQAAIPAVRVTRTLPAKLVRSTGPGSWLFDTEQNLAGWVRLRVNARRGSQITARYRERLTKAGELDDRNAMFVSSGDFQTDRFIASGESDERLEPHFTYHGFQYVEVSGLPGKPAPGSVEACVIQSDFAPAGRFECSVPLLNKIKEATLWSFISNFPGYPTDCPQREKNGWTGDAHLAAETGLLYFDSAPGYRKWVDDLLDSQNEHGEVPAIVPTSGWGYGVGPVWDSALFLVPWYLYVYTGDTRTLRQAYEGMKRYLAFLKGRRDTPIIADNHGDWLPPGGNDRPGKCSVEFLGTAYYFTCARILSNAARVLQREDEAQSYRGVAGSIAAAFHEHFFDFGAGACVEASQTGLACALHLGLVPPDLKGRVLGQLVEAVEQNDFHLDCGIIGTKSILHALSEGGRTDIALAIVTRTTYPSWGHWLARGATTLWEDWEGESSLNHIMFGDIAAWFIRHLAGIQFDPYRPGFRHCLIRPKLAEPLNWAQAAHQSPYGEVASSWRWQDGGLELEVTIPPGCRATVYVPSDDPAEVTESGKRLAAAEGVAASSRFEDAVSAVCESGTYRFASRYGAGSSRTGRALSDVGQPTGL